MNRGNAVKRAAGTRARTASLNMSQLRTAQGKKRSTSVDGALPNVYNTFIRKFIDSNGSTLQWSDQSYKNLRRYVAKLKALEQAQKSGQWHIKALKWIENPRAITPSMMLSSKKLLSGPDTESASKSYNALQGEGTVASRIRQWNTFALELDQSINNRLSDLPYYENLLQEYEKYESNPQKSPTMPPFLVNPAPAKQLHKLSGLNFGERSKSGQELKHSLLSQSQAKLIGDVAANIESGKGGVVVCAIPPGGGKSFAVNILTGVDTTNSAIGKKFQDTISRNNATTISFNHLSTPQDVDQVFKGLNGKTPIVLLDEYGHIPTAVHNKIAENLKTIATKESGYQPVIVPITATPYMQDLDAYQVGSITRNGIEKREKLATSLLEKGGVTYDRKAVLGEYEAEGLKVGKPAGGVTLSDDQKILSLEIDKTLVKSAQSSSNQSQNIYAVFNEDISPAQYAKDIGSQFQASGKRMYFVTKGEKDGNDINIFTSDGTKVYSSNSFNGWSSAQEVNGNSNALFVTIVDKKNGIGTDLGLASQAVTKMHIFTPTELIPASGEMAYTRKDIEQNIGRARNINLENATPNNVAIYHSQGNNFAAMEEQAHAHNANMRRDVNQQYMGLYVNQKQIGQAFGQEAASGGVVAVGPSTLASTLAANANANSQVGVETETLGEAVNTPLSEAVNTALPDAPPLEGVLDESPAEMPTEALEADPVSEATPPDALEYVTEPVGTEVQTAQNATSEVVNPLESMESQVKAISSTAGGDIQTPPVDIEDIQVQLTSLLESAQTEGEASALESVGSTHLLSMLHPDESDANISGRISSDEHMQSIMQDAINSAKQNGESAGSNISGYIFSDDHMQSIIQDGINSAKQNGENTQTEDGLQYRTPLSMFASGTGMSANISSSQAQEDMAIKFVNNGEVKCQCDPRVSLIGSPSRSEELGNSINNTFNGITQTHCNGEKITPDDIAQFKKVVKSIIESDEYKDINASEAMSKWDKGRLQDAIKQFGGNAEPGDIDAQYNKMLHIAKEFQQNTEIKYNDKTQNGILAFRAVMMQELVQEKVQENGQENNKKKSKYGDMSFEKEQSKTKQPAQSGMGMGG